MKRLFQKIGMLFVDLIRGRNYEEVGLARSSCRVDANDGEVLHSGRFRPITICGNLLAEDNCCRDIIAYNASFQPIEKGDLVYIVRETSSLKLLAFSIGAPDGGGSGSQDVVAKKRFKLFRDSKDVIGRGFHRSGWPYVFEQLMKVASDDGEIILDDFVEQTFCYQRFPKPHESPWVGFFHHPPYPPNFGNERERLSVMFSNPEFIESQKHLKLAIALSDYLGDYLKKNLDCPVVVLKHPTSDPKIKWDPEKYEANSNKKIIQVGYYLRNTQLVNQINSIDGFEKIRLWSPKSWVHEFDKKVQMYWMGSDSSRKTYSKGVDRMFVPPREYDNMLSENIIVTEVLDASANNGVIDCIARNAPLFINQHPAVVEYLGEDYPLYFDHPEQIENMIDKVIDAHLYLKNMDKSWMSGAVFANSVRQAIETHT